MNRLMIWVIGGALLVGAAGLMIVAAEDRNGPAFIAGDQPVNENQVREKLQAEGWSNVQIAREGRYFEAIGAKDGETKRTSIDSKTGRLRAVDDGDGDD
jgi:hypothetical protein